MAIREIIVLPDKQLRLVSKPVEKVTTEVRKLADDMFETMYAAPGIGLAAIQVAEPLRLITMDLAKRDEDGGLIRLVRGRIGCAGLGGLDFGSRGFRRFALGRFFVGRGGFNRFCGGRFGFRFCNFGFGFFRF